MSAKLIVITGGPAAERISKFADEHAAFDRTNRKVLRLGDDAYPTEETIARWARNAAAVVLNVDGAPVIFLDEQRAMSAAWIEDAFLRASARRLPVS